MGVPMSLLGSLGLPGMQSLSTDRIFDQFFSKNIKTFEEFHFAFLDVCNKFNSAMPGEHYRTPRIERIKELHSQIQNESDVNKRREILVNFLTSKIKQSPADTIVVMTGLVAPPAAMMLKKAGDSIPQLKKFRLNLIPDFVFVPSVTCLALIGVKLVRLNAGGVVQDESNDAMHPPTSESN